MDVALQRFPAILAGSTGLRCGDIAVLSARLTSLSAAGILIVRYPINLTLALLMLPLSAVSWHFTIPAASDVLWQAQESEEPMGLPFDWHLRPRQVSRMGSTPRAPPSSRGQSRGALGLLRPSMQQFRDFSRRRLQMPMRVRAGAEDPLCHQSPLMS